MPRLKVMTFNIRYDEEADGRHAWRHRRDLAIETVRGHDPDLLGVQEPTAAQWKDVASALPGWVPFGVISEEQEAFDPPGGFIRTARFDARNAGVFWLSETPDVPESVSWPNDWGPRACAWAHLHDRMADRDLLFACTHFDTNAGAWLPSARVLHAELDEIADGKPVILVGDFNCAAGSEAHRYLCDAAGYRDAWTEAGHLDDGIVTFHGFEPSARPSDEARGNYRIDWILLRGPLLCGAAMIDDRQRAGLTPSDHYPAIAEVDWRD